MTAAALDSVDDLRAPARVSRLPRLRRVVGNMGWALLAVLIAGVAAVGVYTHTGRGQLTPVLTGSMRPGIHPGDVVVTKRVPATSLQVGDIIAFVPPHQTLARVHRIYSLDRANNGIVITTKGDANNAIDPWNRISIRGDAYRVSYVIPKAGWLVNGGLRWLILGLVFVGAAFIARWTWQYVRS